MRFTNVSPVFVIFSFLAIATPAFADKIGVAFTGDSNIQGAIVSALKGDGHEVVDVSEMVKDGKLDAVAASAIGSKTGVQLIVFGRKIGGSTVLKVLSAKNDSVQGGVPASDADVAGMVKDLVGKVRSGR